MTFFILFLQLSVSGWLFLQNPPASFVPGPPNETADESKRPSTIEKPKKVPLSPVPGGSPLMVRDPEGIRVIPACKFGPNPGELLRLEDVRISVRVEEDGIRLYRSMSLSPTTVWKPGCDHLFFLGEPLPDGTSDTTAEVIFTLPPRPPATLETLIRSKKGDPATRLIGANLKLAPLLGSPTDYRFRLEILHSVDLPAASETDGIRTLKIPLSHYLQFTPSTSVFFQLQLTLHEPWFFHGATLPETGSLENRFDWEFHSLPEQDLILLFSDESPPEDEDSPAPGRMDSIIRAAILGTLVLALLGFLLFAIKSKHKKKKSRETQK